MHFRGTKRRYTPLKKNRVYLHCVFLLYLPQSSNRPARNKRLARKRTSRQETLKNHQTRLSRYRATNPNRYETKKRDSCLVICIYSRLNIYYINEMIAP